MELSGEVVNEVAGQMDTLIEACEALRETLQREADALGRLDVDEVETLADEKGIVLQSLQEADQALRVTLNRIAEDQGTRAEDVLKEGPLAGPCESRREALKGLRKDIVSENQRVRSRASHGLGFFRALMGSTPSYGAQGEQAAQDRATPRFHRVM